MNAVQAGSRVRVRVLGEFTPLTPTDNLRKKRGPVAPFEVSPSRLD